MQRQSVYRMRGAVKNFLGALGGEVADERSIYGISAVLVVAGYALLIMSVLLMAYGVYGLLWVALEVPNNAPTDFAQSLQPEDAANALKAILYKSAAPVVTYYSIWYIVWATLAGLVGWLSTMKKKISRCNTCGAIASTF